MTIRSLAWTSALCVVIALGACGDDTGGLSGHKDGGGNGDDGGGDGGGDGSTGPIPCHSNLECPAADVCKNDFCVPYDRTCRDSNQCRGDTHCAAGMCVPYDQTFPFDQSCTGTPVPGVFTTDVQCQWNGPTSSEPFPLHRNVLSTPMVADFDLDSDATTIKPSIVIVTYTDNDDGGGNSCGLDPLHNHYGIVRVVDGRACGLQATMPEHVVASSPVALGDVDGDGKPDIVAHREAGGILAWGFSPATAGAAPSWHKLFETPNNTSGNQCYWSGPSLHDLDDDGFPEILQGGIVYAHTGALISEGVPIIPDDYTIDTNNNLIQDYDSVGYIPVVADLDGNGRPELTDGHQILEWNPLLNMMRGDWDVKQSDLGPRGQVAVADFGTFGGNPATDQPLVRDGKPEIVVVSEHQLKVMTPTGRIVFGPIDLPFTMQPGRDPPWGGPPTIADFDGDGRPEISIAGADNLTVFDLDCAAGATTARCPSGRTDGILWSRPAQDLTSNVTGAAVFDFEGDGKAEVVYADECFTRVYDGRSGGVLFSAGHTSCTWYEYPVIADTDADEHAEMVVPSNDACAIQCPAVDPIFEGLRCVTSADCPTGTTCQKDNPASMTEIARCRCTAALGCGTGYSCVDPPGGAAAAGMVCSAKHSPAGQFDRGVKVLKDRLDRWVKARPIWNQHAYSITNVNNDGTIPRTSAWQQNWTVPTLDNYRQNIPGPGLTPIAPSAPDLTVARAKAECVPHEGARMSADVCNRGGAPAAANSRVVFYRVGHPATIACDLHTTRVLGPAECENVSCIYNNPPGVVHSDIVIRVDDDGTGMSGGSIIECFEGDNEDTLADVGCGSLG